MLSDELSDLDYLERQIDALDRRYHQALSAKGELESAIRLVLVAWNGMPDRFKVDPVMRDAIDELRRLVPDPQRAR